MGPIVPWFSHEDAAVANELLHQTVRDVGDIRAKVGGIEARLDKTEETVDRMEGKLDLLVERSHVASGERQTNAAWIVRMGVVGTVVLGAFGALASGAWALAEKFGLWVGKP